MHPRAPGAATAYLLLTLPFGILWFTVTTTGLSVGVSLVIIWIGLPILAGTMMLWRVGARLERRLLRALLGVEIADPYRPVPKGSIWRGLLARAGDPPTWKDLLYLNLLLPLGILWFTLTTVLWGTALVLLARPFYYWALPDDEKGLIDVGDHGYLVIDTLPKALLAAAAGFVLAVAAANAVRGMAFLHGRSARWLLGRDERAELTARVETLQTTRSRALDAAAVERRRIERDLHDGAQQRLVALAMDLGMAREKLAEEPGETRELVERAHEEAKRALAELRDLARGIHPAVLTDRGLDPALSALAARSPVPVDVRVRLDERLSPPLESTAYFLVAEALANVAKRADASEASVLVSEEDGWVVVEVRDDGIGGAESGPASGLTGLAGRVEALDGRLLVSSPLGGPTVVRAELPCES